MIGYELNVSKSGQGRKVAYSGQGNVICMPWSIYFQVTLIAKLF